MTLRPCKERSAAVSLLTNLLPQSPPSPRRWQEREVAPAGAAINKETTRERKRGGCLRRRHQQGDGKRERGDCCRRRHHQRENKERRLPPLPAAAYDRLVETTAAGYSSSSCSSQSNK